MVPKISLKERESRSKTFNGSSFERESNLALAGAIRSRAISEIWRRGAMQQRPRIRVTQPRHSLRFLAGCAAEKRPRKWGAKVQLEPTRDQESSRSDSVARP